ncbi:MAG: sugar ABC transporter permease [Actinomycetota bacterium]|nr:sugar ABC transporter permease [Actinomycetota bacterium]
MGAMPTATLRQHPVAPPSTRAPRRAGGGRRRAQRRLIIALFLVAPLLLLITFTYVPLVNVFRYSLWEWDGLDRNPENVGLENYREVFSRSELIGVFSVSLYYFFGAFIQMAAALYFATVLSFNVRFRNLFKGIIFFPHLINGVAIGFIFLYFFQPDGVLDSLLGLGGMESLQQYWLGDRTYVNYSLAAVSIWRYTGINFVIFLGAIQSIPSELYEASSIDGANRWQQFRYIILPGIRPVIGLLTILAISGAINVFEIPYVITGGANGSTTFVIQTVQTAFQSNKVGLASAMAVVVLVLVLVIAVIQRTFFKDEAVQAT